MKIITVGSAFPENCYQQAELTEALVEFWRTKYFNVERLRAFHQNLLVGQRRFCVTLEELRQLGGFQQRNALYLRHAVDLGEQAILAALKQAGLYPEAIDHIFFTTITGIAAPSIDARLVNRLGLKSNIRRTPIFGLGCLGGAAGIARAADYLQAYPEQIALVLSVELCSLTMQKEDLSIANIVGSGLFGDGAAAVVLAGANTPWSGPRILKTHASFYAQTERVMGWDLVDEGFKLVLSPHVSEMVHLHARRDIEALLEGTGWNLAELKHYLCHPGGPKVLEALQMTLGLSPQALRLSWETLQNIGNLSSTSVLLILKETLEQICPQAGELGVLMAMGPGFCSEWVLLQW